MNIENGGPSFAELGISEGGLMGRVQQVQQERQQEGQEDTAASKFKGEIPQGGLMGRVEEVKARAEIGERNPDLNKTLLTTAKEVEQRLIQLAPRPGETAQDYQRRAIFATREVFDRAITNNPAPETETSKMFR